MKALVYTEPKKLVMQEWPEPVLDPGDAMVRVHAVAVCGSDIHGWLGHSRGRVPPLVLGHELAGVVEEISGDGAAAKSGDRVAVYPLIGCEHCEYCKSGRDYICRRRKVLGLHVNGGFAELLKVPAKNLYPLPDQNNFIEGALIEPFACGVHMVGKCGDEHGPIAILGAGPIGLMALQAARQQNFSKIAVVELNANRSAQARQLGADLTVNPKETNCSEQLEEFFGEDGCFAVFDAAGFSATRQLAVRLVRTGGLVVSAGLGDQESPLDYVDLIRREIRVEGVFAYNRRDFQTAADIIAAGRLNSKGWVSEAPLADGQAVFEDLIRPDSKRGKVVLTP
jgi:L-gulonate 5-dehydrogenase